MSDDQRIVVESNGPYAVDGGVPLARKSKVMSEHGEPLAWRKDETFPPEDFYLLCRCGQSGSKPFCDGSHERVGFEGAEAADTGPIADRQTVYEGTGITVQDDRSICAHAGFCANGATNAWKMVRNTEDTQVRAQLMAMIERCPSGALSYSVDPDGEAIEPDLSSGVTVIPNGPLWVSGKVTLERSDGEKIEVRNRLTLCRCGASKHKPLCDGSHTEIAFSAE